MNDPPEFSPRNSRRQDLQSSDPPSSSASVVEKDAAAPINDSDSRRERQQKDPPQASDRLSLSRGKQRSPSRPKKNIYPPDDPSASFPVPKVIPRQNGPGSKFSIDESYHTPPPKSISVKSPSQDYYQFHRSTPRSISVGSRGNSTLRRRPGSEAGSGPSRARTLSRIRPPRNGFHDSGYPPTNLANTSLSGCEIVVNQRSNDYTYSNSPARGTSLRSGNSGSNDSREHPSVIFQDEGTRISSFASTSFQENTRSRGDSTRRRRQKSSKTQAHPDYYSYDDGTIESLSTRDTSYSVGSTMSTSRLTRSISMIIVFILICWWSFLGIEMGIELAKGAISLLTGLIGVKHKEKPPVRRWEENKNVRFSEADGAFEHTHSNNVGLRGGTSPGIKVARENFGSHSLGGMSHHDRDAYLSPRKTNDSLVDAKKKDAEKNEEQTNPKQTDKQLDNSELKPDTPEGYQYEMGQDATKDFFFAGKVTDDTLIINNNEAGNETAPYPSESYATLPFSIDSNPFVLSIWIHLSPNASGNENDENNKLGDDRRSRVILSTRSNDSRGCKSDRFGGPAIGMVLYAQPHHDDSNSETTEDDELALAQTYQIVLEYAMAGNQRCHTLIGANQNVRLVREGEWHHIALFVTRTIPDEVWSEDGDERISLYVDANLAGREDNVPRRFPSRGRKLKTIVGRHEIQNDENTVEISSESYSLGGRVGMLSYWEIGGPASLSEASERMKVQSERDEDHVVRAVNRAAFDVRALKELPLQGLTVKDPTLLYTFDGQKSNSTDVPSQKSASFVKEAMSGMNGAIVSLSKERIDASSVQQKEPFVPLGGNRYSEYRNGAYVPPEWKDSELQELNEIAHTRRDRVKEAMKHAWKGYQTYAWGKDELLPLTKAGQDNWGGMGTTLIDSLSTLWMMELKEEFSDARDWVRDHLDFSNVGAVSVFETTIRNLGGLLSAFDLSNDTVFLEKADDLGRRLLRAFSTPHGVPYGETELHEGGRSYNTGWHQNSAVLSEIGTLQVEFRYLARVTGKTEYATVAMRALDELLKLNTDSGLFPTFIHNTKQTLSFGNNAISIGAMGDSFYEYLLKVWLQGGKTEIKYRRMYDKAVDGILEKLIYMSRPSYLTYVAEMNIGNVVHKMDHLSCYLGGNLALGAYTHPDGLSSTKAQRQLKAGKQLAYTCYQMYARSKSGLSPEYVSFNNAKDDFVKAYDAPFYILRPEAAETFFILFHLTGDPVYREWGWEVFQAIEEHCRTDIGYSAIKDVDTLEKENRMESFFMAETLKYLYLLQDDSHQLDLLNKHVLNTEAHPLRLLNLASKPDVLHNHGDW